MVVTTIVLMRLVRCTGLVRGRRRGWLIGWGLVIGLLVAVRVAAAQHKRGR
jgi:hypothetical protein